MASAYSFVAPPAPGITTTQLTAVFQGLGHAVTSSAALYLPSNALLRNHAQRIVRRTLGPVSATATLATGYIELIAERGGSWFVVLPGWTIIGFRSGKGNLLDDVASLLREVAVSGCSLNPDTFEDYPQYPYLVPAVAAVGSGIIAASAPPFSGIHVDLYVAVVVAVSLSQVIALIATT